MPHRYTRGGLGGGDSNFIRFHMYRALMVPLDGSTFSRHAIPWALALAQPAGAVVHLVQVVRPDGIEMPNALLRDADVARDHRTAQQEAVGDLANRLSISTGVSFVAAIEAGDPERELTNYAASNAIDLVVMSTHGRGGFARMLLGSVSDGLIRRGVLPVLLIRPNKHDPEEHEPAAVSDVLVPLDESREGEQIVEHAIEISELTGAACVLLHVEVLALVSAVAAFGDNPGPTAVPRAQSDTEISHARVADRLTSIADRFRARSVPVSTAIVQDADAASGILKYCQSHPVSLIAMTTHGLQGLDRALVGSAATTLIRQTALPVLVLRRDAAPQSRE
jgi:nucleotide-binding universal stress UspA family protein